MEQDMGDNALYPAMKWTTAGDSILVMSVESDSPSYLDHHPNDPACGDVKVQTKQKLTKAQVIDLLDGGRVIYDPKASAADLRDALAEAMRAALVAAGISFNTDADLETLHATLMAGA